MYKKSSYNVIVETFADGKQLVFNTMTAVLGIMDASTQSICNAIESVSTETCDDTAKKNIFY